jgi:3'-phosphoadenosine 5'-phosphosulfate sulfotransferase (PAPS reductase)/FAD synthetase
MKSIACFSGGKDSTAMLLRLIEDRDPLDEIVFYDTGWEWPQLYDHIDDFEQRTQHHVTRLKPPRPWDYYLTDHPVTRRRGPGQGKVYRHGYGWPVFNNRWCSRMKKQAVDAYIGPDVQRYMGIAADELQRVYSTDESFIDENYRFPLIDRGITQAMALDLCRRAGYHWGGLYDHIPRVSCMLCPLQRLDQMRFIRKTVPSVWQRMLQLDARIEKNRGFWNGKTVADLEARFKNEERQGALCLPVSPIIGSHT